MKNLPPTARALGALLVLLLPAGLSAAAAKERFRKPPAAGKALIVLLAVCILAFGSTAYAISLITTSSQNFDSIGTSATATLPTDWKVDKNTTVRSLGTYSAAVTATEQVGGNNLATNATNGIYNYGAGVAGSAADRAVGWLSSSSATKSGNLYAMFTNTTGQSLPGLTISYDVEKYRNGSNAAGFSIQMYYSTDGSTWTSAGSNFLTSFAADADNNGYASAPGATVSISLKPLTFASAIAAGNTFYLAWNYSVTSGTTTSNAQALGVDNVLVIADIVPSVTGTDPTNGATGVALNKDIGITFSEAVNVASGWYTISCGTSGSHTAVVTGGPTIWTLNPDADFSYGETCTVTILAAKVTDQDTIDPPDNMASNYVFTFQTVSLTDAAPSVTGTDPTNGTTSVALNKDIGITFSEAVNVASGWYTISCGTSGSHTAVVTGGPTIWTLNPDADFSYGETCTVTILAAKVTDQDTIDPPDNMAANYPFTFTTMADPCPNTGLTLISAIQGSGTSAALTGVRTVQGIVIGDYETTGRKGYFVQEEDADADGNPATSEGIFVYDANTTSEVSLGDKVRVTGTVTEFNSLTELGTITSQIVCTGGQGALVTTTPVSLPAADSTALERYEGMRVSFAQALTVTDNYDLGRYGQLTLSEGGKLWQYTHLNAPNNPGYANYLAGLALRSIILDDGSPTQNLDPIFYPGAGLTAANTVRVGDTVAGLTAVLDQFTAYQLQPIGQVAFTAANPRPAAPPAVGGNVKVVGFNALNFFTTVDTTGGTTTGVCGPAGNQNCRGADSADEFTRQRDKLVAAICGLNADVLGLTELENPYSGNDPLPSDGVSDYVLQNLVAALNGSTACPDDYAFTDNTAAGADAIRQGLIYKPAVVTPVGATAILQTPAFINGGDSAARNRPALTQAFEVNDGGERFIVSVNHLKSKGSACDTADANDGQGNCAVVRTNAANALTAWLATDPTGTGDPDILIIGDLNSYAKEDPITALAGAGYTDLVNWTVGSAGYSYGFDGMMGYLDHALANSPLLAQALAANEWHINSPEPAALDYNTEFKTASQVSSLYNADAYRSADHDPVLVGLGLSPDRSDLASGYGQAWHTGQGNPWRLGALWTGEATSTAGGDNTSDDGVTRNTGESWNDGRGEVSVTVTGPAGKYACLNAWLDYSDGAVVAGMVETPNGAFDANEHVIANRVMSPGAGQLVTWPLEGGVINGAATYNMRFRLVPAPNPAVADCSGVTLAAADGALAPEGGASPTGRADGGEVEDDAFTAGPLAIELEGLNAANRDGGVLVTWQTAQEINNLGFNLYRATSPAGPAIKLNAALIPSQAPGSGLGASYDYLDAYQLTPGATYYYWLETVSSAGIAARLEPPAIITYTAPTAVRLSGFRAAAASPAALPPVGAGLLALLVGAALLGRRFKGR